MNDWRQSTHDDYRRKGLAGRMGFGRRPALLVVDFIYGFTDPATPRVTLANTWPRWRD